MYAWCWVSRKATFVRFIYDDLLGTFSNVCNGIVVGDIWDSSVRYVTCTNQMGSCIVGVGVFVYVSTVVFDCFRLLLRLLITLDYV